MPFAASHGDGEIGESCSVVLALTWWLVVVWRRSASALGLVESAVSWGLSGAETAGAGSMVARRLFLRDSRARSVVCVVLGGGPRTGKGVSAQQERTASYVTES